MAENSRMSKLSEKDDECIFTWKLFTAWDYMIGNAETAHNRVASVVMGFKEALLEEAEKKREARNWRVICFRVLVNTIVLGLLSFSAFAVIMVVKRSTEPEANSTVWRKNEITVVMSLITLFFPMLFEVLGLLEQYHPRKQLRLQLARIMVLNLLNLYSLIFALFDKISDMTEELKHFENISRVPSNIDSNVVQIFSPTDVQTNCVQVCMGTDKYTNPIAIENLISSLVNNITNVSYPEIVKLITETYNNTAMTTSILPQAEYFNSTIANSLYNNETDYFSSSFNFSADFDDYLKFILYPFMNVISNDNNQLNLTLLEPFFESTATPVASTFDDNLSTISTTLSTSIESSDNCSLICNNLTTSVTPLITSNLNYSTRARLRSRCWETMFGQELIKLTVMDLIMTVLSTLAIDFFRGLFVRYMNRCWCWDLEKKFPQYGDFKVAENILHLVNNQGMVWMGMFFSPGLVVLNVAKLYIMMYLRAWAVLTCNVPHEIIFRASRSNNFYYALLLMMLFLCVLPVGYAIVWIKPSWHCGPFSKYERIFHIFTKTIRNTVPESMQKALDYIASPGIVIPLLVLLILIIYYLISLTGALREANNDLKTQLRRERTEERRKMFQIVDKRRRASAVGGDLSNTPFTKWKKILGSLPSGKSFDDSPKIESDELPPVIKEEKTENKGIDFFSKFIKKALGKSSTSEEDHNGDDGTDTEQHESLPEDINTNKNPPLNHSISNEIHEFQKNVSRASSLKKKRRRLTQSTDINTDAIKHVHIKEKPFKLTHQDTFELRKNAYTKRSFDETPSTSKEFNYRQDSVSSNWSDNIPVIKISKTESSENICEDKIPKTVNHGEERKKFKPKIKCALQKQSTEIDEDSICYFGKEVHPESNCTETIDYAELQNQSLSLSEDSEVKESSVDTILQAPLDSEITFIDEDNKKITRKEN